MKELIFIHLGGCGCRIGSDLWQLFAQEHALDNGGYYNEQLFEKSRNLESNILNTPESSAPPPLINNLSCLYDESFKEENKYHPRSLFIDTDPTIVKQLKSDSILGECLRDENLICGNEDASSNFAKAYFGLVRDHKDYIKERIRKMLESCDCAQSLLFTHSIGGGTGSGYLGSLSYRLRDEFGVSASSFTVLPSMRYSTAIVEPYNAALGLTYFADYMNSIFAFDNQSLFNSCIENGVEDPYYKEMNRLISQCISSITSQIRFSSDGMDFDSICDSLTPFQGVNFISNTFTNIRDINPGDLRLDQLFSKRSLMNDVDHTGGLSISMNLSMRGNFSLDHSKFLSNQVKHFGSTPTNTTQIVHKMPITAEGSTMKLDNTIHVANNTSSIAKYFENQAEKVGLLLSKFSFAHWYCGEGMECRELYEARETLESIIAMYKKDY